MPMAIAKTAAANRSAAASMPTVVRSRPDRVARWVGAGGENLGEESDHKAMTGGASNIIYTGAGQGGSGGRSMVQQAGSKAQKGKEAAEAAEDAKWSKRLGGGGAASKVEPSGVTQGADKPNKTEEE